MVEYLGHFGYWDLGSISSVLWLSPILRCSVALCGCIGVYCAKCLLIACSHCSLNVSVIHNTSVAVYGSLLQLGGVQDDSRVILLLSIHIDSEHSTQSGIEV